MAVHPVSGITVRATTGGRRADDRFRRMVEVMTVAVQVCDLSGILEMPEGALLLGASSPSAAPWRRDDRQSPDTRGLLTGMAGPERGPVAALRGAYLLLRKNHNTASTITPPIHSGRSRAKLFSTHDMADRIVVSIPLKAPEPAYSPIFCEMSTPEYRTVKPASGQRETLT
jgi:hypothetical protein